MKKYYALIGIFVFLIFIWYLINSDDISEMNEIHKITQQKERGLFPLSEKQGEQLEKYIKEITEIKVRECSAGAKILFIRCGFTDSVGRYALGNNIYQAIIETISQDRADKMINMFSD